MYKVGGHNYNMTLIATTFLLLIVNQKNTHGAVIVNMKILKEDIQYDYSIRQGKKLCFREDIQE